MKKLLLLIAAGLIIQATPVLAEGHEGGKHGKKGQMFEKHDTNGDGMISEAEFLAKAKAKFAEKDINEKRKEMRQERKARNAE